MDNTTAPTATDLIPLIGYTKDAAQVEALGFQFDAGIPAIGEVIWAYSRGGLRQGIVTHVTKTGNVEFAYVTQGGVDDVIRGEEYARTYLASDFDRTVEEALAQAIRNRAYCVQEVNPATAKYTRSATDLARYAVEAARTDEDLRAECVAKEQARRADVAERLARPVADKVGVTHKRNPAAKVARRV